MDLKALVKRLIRAKPAEQIDRRGEAQGTRIVGSKRPWYCHGSLDS
jgi:hypothetical protein